MGIIQCSREEGQWLAHSLRAGRLGPVPACVQPLQIGLDTGNEAKGTSVMEMWRSDSKKRENHWTEQGACHSVESIFI